MSKIGFRSALFGFNKDDVNLYLIKLQQEYSAKEQEKNLKLSELERDLKELAEKQESMNAELEKAKTELEYYKGKEAEIERMSVSIGTMYLVAKQNADQMIHTAEECAAQINEFSARQLDAAAKAGKELNEMRESAMASADRFGEELKRLTADLDDSKSRLEATLNASVTPKEITVGGNEDE